MKKALVIFLLLISTRGVAQQFSITELFSILNSNNIDDANVLLSRKGWKFDEAKKPDEENISIVTWSLDKDEYSGRASGWFNLFLQEGVPVKIYIGFSKINLITSIKTSLLSQKAKFVKSSIQNNIIISNYTLNTNIITLATEIETGSSKTSSNNSTTYYVEIIKGLGYFDTNNGFKKIYENGILTAEYFLKDGELTGTAKSYNENGKVKIVSNFIKGKRNGVTREFNIKGELEEEYTYLNDTLNGTATSYYYVNDILFAKETGKYLNGKKNGLWELVRTKDKQPNKPLAFTNYFYGIPEGAFKRIQGDSIILGSYKTGLKDGVFKIYIDINRMLFGGEATGDTSKAVLIVDGYYKSNNKFGIWKEFSFTSALKSQGSYSNDLKTGEWKYYIDTYFNEGSTEKAPYSNKLYLVEYYLNGLLDGKRIQSGYLLKTQVPCDSAKLKTNNKIDTCYRLQFVKINETSTYKNGELDGLFESIDSSGILKTKGNYIKGEKSGEWIEGYSSDGLIEYVNMYIYQKGSYLHGERIGKWVEYFNNEHIGSTFEYKDGVINGEIRQFRTSDKLSSITIMEDGYIKSIDLYDSVSTKIIKSYITLNETSSEFRFREIINDSTGKTESDYLIKKLDSQPFSYRNFELNLIFYVGVLSTEKTGYLEGNFIKYYLNNQIEIEGSYLEGKKEGVWNYFNYEGKLIKTETYINGALQ